MSFQPGLGADTTVFVAVCTSTSRRLQKESRDSTSAQPRRTPIFSDPGHGGVRTRLTGWLRGTKTNETRNSIEKRMEAEIVNERIPSTGVGQSCAGGPGTKLLLRLPKQAKASGGKGFRAWHRCAGDVKTAAPTHRKMHGDRARPRCRDDGLRRRVHLDIAEDRLAQPRRTGAVSFKLQWPDFLSSWPRGPECAPEERTREAD